jgi:hypothetical protein
MANGSSGGRETARDPDDLPLAPGLSPAMMSVIQGVGDDDER